MLVEFGDRLACAFGIAHFNKRESTWLAGGAIADDIDARDRSGCLEQRLQIGFGRFVGKITDVQLGAHERSCIVDASNSDNRLEQNARTKRRRGEKLGSDAEAGKRCVRKTASV